MPLVRIVKDWTVPDLLRQTPGGRGFWDSIQFTLDPVEDCDFVVFLNNRMTSDVRVRCPRERIWAIMQEPYIELLHAWMIEGHEFFSRVYTHHLPGDDPKYIASHPAVPWHVDRRFDELVSARMPPKSRSLSWVTSNLTTFPGQKKRMAFLRFLQQTTLAIDIFGRGLRPIKDKWDGLAPYRYSLAIENASGPDYWTEKIADCFLCWTVPIYYGCVNPEDYFPEASFIRIDIEQPEASLKKIRTIIQEDDWSARLPALEEARDLVLHRYQFFPYLASLIHHEPTGPREPETITIPAYHPENAFWKALRSHLSERK